MYSTVALSIRPFLSYTSIVGGGLPPTTIFIWYNEFSLFILVHCVVKPWFQSFFFPSFVPQTLDRQLVYRSMTMALPMRVLVVLGGCSLYRLCLLTKCLHKYRSHLYSSAAARKNKIKQIEKRILNLLQIVIFTSSSAVDYTILLYSCACDNSIIDFKQIWYELFSLFSIYTARISRMGRLLSCSNWIKS